jgi:hypothetical protein
MKLVTESYVEMLVVSDGRLVFKTAENIRFHKCSSGLPAEKPTIWSKSTHHGRTQVEVCSTEIRETCIPGIEPVSGRWPTLIMKGSTVY